MSTNAHRHALEKLPTHRNWDALRLSPIARQQLIEFCDQHRKTRGGFQQATHPARPGNASKLLILAGTDKYSGKTMVGAIAADLGLDPYRIDLSAVVSKYIGETEKNLDKLFADAARSNAILFFDEADALFGKRTDVKDSHDRYANIEINYLLQRIEQYRGLVILASNMIKPPVPPFPKDALVVHTR